MTGLRPLQQISYTVYLTDQEAEEAAEFRARLNLGIDKVIAALDRKSAIDELG